MKTPALQIPVDEYTTPSPATAKVSDTFRTLKARMQEGSFRHLPITDQGRIVGMVSARDLKLIEGLGDIASKLVAQDFMASDPYVVGADTPLEQVVLTMSARKIGSAVVQYPDGELGIFTSTDALNALVEILRGDLP